MKRILLITIFSLATTNLIHAKALPVRCPQRSQQAQVLADQNELKNHLLNSSCRTILIQVHDTESALNLIRYARPLKERNKTVVCKAPEQIRTLLSWCPYVDQVVHEEDAGAYDACIALEDLACLMDETHKAMTTENKPYIQVSEPMLALWQDAFITDANFKVGICCTPINHTSYKQKQSLSMESFLPLGCMQHMSMYSFDDISSVTVPDTMHLFHFGAHKKLELTDMAAVIHHMDLIITTQPVIAYLAGALGKQVWFIAHEHMNAEEIQDALKQLRVFTQSADNKVIFDIMHELAYTIEKPTAQIVTAEIATGELIDKMTILEIKTERITDQKKLDNIWKELHSLQRTYDEFVAVTPKLEQLTQDLKAANEALWTTEDLIRDKEREKSFDNEFVLLARSVYIQNDERCRVKREINELLGSRLVEEKSYKPYN